MSDHSSKPTPAPDTGSAVRESEQLRKLVETEHWTVLEVIDAVRRRRRSIEQLAASKLRRTQSKLQEASNTTRIAASDMLDGLDRAMTFVDELDACAAEAGETEGRAHDARGALRDELFALMAAMQFQDIATQQLASASSVLAEVEARLADVASALHAQTPAEGAGGVLPAAFDPDATMLNREERQANADEIYELCEQPTGSADGSQ